MDNSKVNGLSVPPQAHATAAQLPRANQVATDRFSRAMGDSPRSSVTTADAPDGVGRGAIRATPMQNLIREAPQENREHAYRRLQGPLGSGVIGMVAGDVAADLVKERTRAPVDPTELASAGSVWSQFAVATQTRDMVVPRGASAGELTQMLERMCSGLYVGEKSVGTQRLVIALDHVLPGAAAEIVREGVHLSIRLHARTEESYRSMSTQRDQLIRALNDDGNRRVDVSVVHGDEKSFGDGHG